MERGHIGKGYTANLNSCVVFKFAFVHYGVGHFIVSSFSGTAYFSVATVTILYILIIFSFAEYYWAGNWKNCN